jgi:hypothetical protein
MGQGGGGGGPAPKQVLFIEAKVLRRVEIDPDVRLHQKKPFFCKFVFEDGSVENRQILPCNLQPIFSCIGGNVWFLTSDDEKNVMVLKKSIILGFAKPSFWNAISFIFNNRYLLP